MTTYVFKDSPPPIHIWNKMYEDVDNWLGKQVCCKSIFEAGTLTRVSSVSRYQRKEKSNRESNTVQYYIL